MVRSMVILSVTLFFTSCGIIANTSQFRKGKSFPELDGCYYARTYRPNCYGQEQIKSNYENILTAFNINDYAEEFEIRFETPERIRLSYYTFGDATKKDTVFHGKLKGKFFEICFKKEQLIIPIIYGSRSLDRVRIGAGKNGGLAIEKAKGYYEYILIMSGGMMFVGNYVCDLVTDNHALIPQINGDKWGYVDRSENYAISPQYEFACRFERDVARVMIGGKWGLIDADGRQISRQLYDWISPIDTLGTPCFTACDMGKIGLLSMCGDEIIPIVCDELRNVLTQTYGTFRIGDLKGIATREGVVYPAMFSDINNSEFWGYNGDNPKGIIAQVKKDGRTYVIDKEGYGYEIPNASFWNNKVDWKNKIKMF